MIRRNYKNVRGNTAINQFLGVAVGAVTSASLRAMQKVARRGVDNLVNNVAKFSDYTGVLINSYQAAILVTAISTLWVAGITTANLEMQNGQ